MAQHEPTTPRYCPRCGQGTDVEICPDDGSPTFLRALRSAETRMLAVGDVISGRYRIEGILGQGGFGAVFAAEHLMTGQPVAVKVMIGDFGVAAEDLVQRFLQEARITASLSHPNTVRIYDFGQTKTGVLFMAMEQLRGPTLEARLHAATIAGTALSETETIAIGVQVLRSLTEAHSAGLVHRDLKPGNLILVQMVGEPDIVKVLDFGIARPRDSVLTQTGTALGTPTFMSPEQARSEVPDGRSDLYSLGCILFACVAGEPPFVGDSTMSVLLAHQLHALPNLRDVARVPVSEAFVQCIERATAKKVGGRFADAVAMREALEAIVVAPTPPAPAGDDVWAPTMESDVIGVSLAARTLAGDGIARLVSSQTLAADGVAAPGLVGLETTNALPSDVQLPDDTGDETVLNDIIEAAAPQPTPTMRSHPARPRSSAQVPTLATPSALRTVGRATGNRPAARPAAPTTGKHADRPRGQTASQQLRARKQGGGPQSKAQNQGAPLRGRPASAPQAVATQARAPQAQRTQAQPTHAHATPSGGRSAGNTSSANAASASRDFGDDLTPAPAVLPSTRTSAPKPPVAALVSAVVLAAIVLGVGGWWALRKDGDSARPPAAAAVVTAPTQAKESPADMHPTHDTAAKGTAAKHGDQPRTDDPTAPEPGVHAAGTVAPTAPDPVGAAQLAAQPATGKPTAAEPAAAEPAAAEPAAAEPAAAEPAAAKTASAPKSQPKAAAQDHGGAKPTHKGHDTSASKKPSRVKAAKAPIKARVPAKKKAKAKKPKAPARDKAFDLL